MTWSAPKSGLSLRLFTTGTHDYDDDDDDNDRPDNDVYDFLR